MRSIRRAIVAGLALVLVATSIQLPAATARASAGLTALERDELAYGYRQLTSEFYKRVDAQNALDGARLQLVAYLQKSGVKAPTVAAVRATDDSASNVRALTQSVGAAVSQYSSRVTPRTATYAALSGLLGSVHDRYTQFLSPKEYSDLNEGLDGTSFGGVGLSIGIDELSKTLKVQSVIEGGPAEKAGVLADDVITTINGKSTKGLTLDADSKLLRGAPGTIARLTIVRDGKPVAPLQIARAQIKSPSVYSKLLEGGIGYTRLSVFGANTAVELGTALHKLEVQGVKAYVLDLRDNGGGYLNAAIDVSSKFVSTGPIVTVAERAGSRREYDADDVAVAPKPLVVLVNKYTASASEITSGAIKDNGVGTLVGQRTFGKGVVQTIFPLPDGAAVKITTARYLTPSGRDINSVGIQPDVIVAAGKNTRYGDPTRDTQLQTAIGVLKTRLEAMGG